MKMHRLLLNQTILNVVNVKRWRIWNAGGQGHLVMPMILGGLALSNWPRYDEAKRPNWTCVAGLRFKWVEWGKTMGICQTNNRFHVSVLQTAYRIWSDSIYKHGVDFNNDGSGVTWLCYAEYGPILFILQTDYFALFPFPSCNFGHMWELVTQKRDEITLNNFVSILLLWKVWELLGLEV